MHEPLWIVVANGSRARVLQRTHAGAALTEVHDWVHPATRMHRPDTINPHRQSGIQGRSGLAERSTAQDHERTAFARDICHWLSQALQTHAQGRVALLSSNPFLGDLVAQGRKTLQQHLCASHAVDLTHLTTAQLAQRLHDDYRL